MNVTVFGTGYVGLVQGATLANAGHHVICVDIDVEKIRCLQTGAIPFYEPGLEQLVKIAIEKGLLQFTTDVSQAVHHSNLQFIAVGTPSNHNGQADLRYVMSVAASIAEHMDSYQLIVNKSTVPLGTADLVREKIATVLAVRHRALPFDVASNPEFLKEGSAVFDCQYPDRIIIGAAHERVNKILSELYAPFVQDQHTLIMMDIRSAELTKYAANAMLATKISFINEIANLAEKYGADIQAICQGIGADPRIGPHFIAPGAGYGGSCFPKDVRALIQSAAQVGLDPVLLKAVDTRNVEQKKIIFNKISQYFDGDLADKKVALWGLSFKPNTSDMREAASLVLLENLWEAGAIVQAFDPVAGPEADRLFGQQNNFIFCDTKEAALQHADFLVIMTEWPEFYKPDFELLYQSLKQPLIFDGRNLFMPKMMADQGFIYQSIGRSSEGNIKNAI